MTTGSTRFSTPEQSWQRIQSAASQLIIELHAWHLSNQNPESNQVLYN
jgi:hypothetical protein